MSKNDEEDVVEGVEITSTDGWGEYPLDSVFVRTEPRTVEAVVERITKKRYILDPEFQRDFLWPVQKQSKLIESCIMRIPLPVFYVAESIGGEIIIVDGLQRLTTFSRFVGNQFKLTGLSKDDNTKKTHPLEGKKFDDLPINLKERVLDTPLIMYILDAKAPERARLDIFDRVNSGEPLTRQQMRNALYSGVATKWLKDASKDENFRLTTGNSLNVKTMRDREAINRFCAFILLGRKNFTNGDMDGFLAEGLIKLASISERQRKSLRKKFDNALALNYKLFKEHAFRKSLASSPNAPRSVINISFFEVCTVVMASLPIDKLTATEEGRIKRSVIKLMSNEEFTDAITYSTNSTASVKSRFSLMEQAIKG